jgi:hypothetical protein
MARGDPNEVMIAVRRETLICPRPECPGTDRTCPEVQAYLARLADEAAASQGCVRAAIAAAGGTASPEVFVFGNAVLATLTWAQIQTIAARTDVGSIDPNSSGTPPP